MLLEKDWNGHLLCVLFRMIPSSIPAREEGCWPKAFLGAYCVQEQLVGEGGL